MIKNTELRLAKTERSTEIPGRVEGHPFF